MAAWLTPNLLREESQKIIHLTNELRSQQGVDFLRENELLNHAAYSKAEDMIYQEYFAHIGPNQLKIGDWLKQNNYQYLVAGENLAMGFSGAEETVNAWIKSPTHYANLIDPLYQEIGVGMVSGPFQNIETTLVAQFFARPQVHKETSPLEILDLTIEPEIVFDKTKNIEEPKVKPIKEKVAEAEIETLEVVEAEIETVEVVEEKTIPVVEIVPLEDLDEERDSMVIQEVSRGEVLGEEVIISLEKPILISPSDQFLNNKKDLSFRIYALGAEKVSVLFNDQLIGIADSDQNQENYFDYFGQKLEEGEITILLRAERGEEKMLSSAYILVNDFSAPKIDLNNSRVWIDEPEDGSEKIILVQVSLDGKAKQVIAKIEGINISLTPRLDNMLEWTGQIIFFKGDQELAPITLPSVLVEDLAGNQANYDLEWENLKPAKTSLFEQYCLKKKYPSKYLKLILNLGSWFYKILLFILIITLTLNIFIQIKHQNIKIILISLGGIILLIIFLLI